MIPIKATYTTEEGRQERVTIVNILLGGNNSHRVFFIWKDGHLGWRDDLLAFTECQLEPILTDSV